MTLLKSRKIAQGGVVTDCVEKAAGAAGIGIGIGIGRRVLLLALLGRSREPPLRCNIIAR
jgi:hypothetical protein